MGSGSLFSGFSGIFINIFIYRNELGELVNFFADLWEIRTDRSRNARPQIRSVS